MAGRLIWGAARDRPRVKMTSGAKQDPTEKKQRALAADGKCYFSYAQIAAAVSRTVPEVEAFNPDVFVAIGGGGFIPARMLRTEVKVRIQPTLGASCWNWDPPKPETGLALLLPM